MHENKWHSRRECRIFSTPAPTSWMPFYLLPKTQGCALRAFQRLITQQGRLAHQTLRGVHFVISFWFQVLASGGRVVLADSQLVGFGYTAPVVGEHRWPPGGFVVACSAGQSRPLWRGW